MKISHIDLERCVNQPRQWLREQSASGHAYNLGYERILKLAIWHFHRVSSGNEARRRLQDLIIDHDLKNKRRVDEIQVELDLYIKWCESSDANTAEAMIRILLDVGGYLQMSGTISRVDVTKKGYRGILLGTKQSDWKQQLRMPLIQKALSERYARELDTIIEVGIQNLDGSSLQTQSFSLREIGQAEKEFIRLGETVKKLVP